MDPIPELEERLGRYPAERYPVQHALAQFHLGVALTNAGASSEARRALERAVQLFAAAGMEVERAKALNALGAALRDAGELESAACAFAEAADVFAVEGLAAEEAAGLFNLGLVRRDPEPLERARDLFAGSSLDVQTAAAERELGTVWLERGDTDRAIAALTNAVGRARDESGRGAASNALGLALLACGRLQDAIETFRAATAAHPRTVRPAEFAMAKANLALAHERTGDLPRARLAARQALGAAGSAAAVVAQAEGVLTRLGPVEDDLARVLATEEPERRAALVREEVNRWAGARPTERPLDAAAWVSAQLADPELAETWLAALLELPPEAMQIVVQSALDELPSRTGADQEQFRRTVTSASARFHAPQMERLLAAFGWT